jgi:hypothetical protein
MRGSLSVRIATLVLVASLAAPAFAAPPRGDSPLERVERTISRIVQHIKHVLDMPVLSLPPG